MVDADIRKNGRSPPHVECIIVDQCAGQDLNRLTETTWIFPSRGNQLRRLSQRDVLIAGIENRLDCGLQTALQTFWKIANMARSNRGWIVSRVLDRHQERSNLFAISHSLRLLRKNITVD